MCYHSPIRTDKQRNRGVSMKFYKLDNWNPNFRHDGLLYFTQRIQEMLYYYAPHIHKTPVHNTHTLALEYLHVAKLARNKTIHENHLKHIMEEFQESFANDLIIRGNIDEERRRDIIQRLNSSSQIEQEKTMNYLYSALSDYNKWCIKFLKEIVPQEKEKKKIDRALRCFIPGLLGAGYSSEFIFHFNKEVFSCSAVDSLSSLDVFLDRFDFEKKKYKVCLAIEKKALRFKDILEERLEANFKFDDDCTDLKFDKAQYELVQLNISALDERTASNKAYEQLYLFFRYYNFIGDQKSDWLFNVAKVIDESNASSFVRLRSVGFDFPSQPENYDTGRVSEQLLSLLLHNARNSFSTIDRAVAMHNIAISERDLRNGFLNFWSVFEILFVSEQADSKITEIEKKVLPILKRDYLHSLIDELERNLKDNFSNAELNTIQKMMKAEDQQDWLKFALFLPEYDEVRTKLYTLLKDYPLLRSRVSQFYSDFSDKQNLLAELERFTRRISWHLKRLYRTRNAIIHAGQNPTNLKSLGEHLHSYIDSCLVEIITLLATEEKLKTIDNVIIDIQLNEATIMRCLQPKEKVDKQAIAVILE